MLSATKIKLWLLGFKPGTMEHTEAGNRAATAVKAFEDLWFRWCLSRGTLEASRH